MSYRILTQKDFKSVPWKNGKGITSELIAYKRTESDSFMWRLSVARISEDGFFSDFSGYDRTLTILEGNGVMLKHSNGVEQILQHPLDSAEFKGEWNTYASLTNGPCKDFNVISDRRYCSSKLFIAQKPIDYSINSDHFLVYSLCNEALTLFNNRSIVLNLGELLHIENFEYGNFQLKNGKAIFISILKHFDF